MSKRILINVIFFSAILAACSDSKPKYIDEVDLVPPSPLIIENFTLKGVDSDMDGVRDDVELWINEKFEDSNMRKALKLVSKIEYRMMFVKSVDEATILEKDLVNAKDCLKAASLSLAGGMEKAYENLEQKMFNNWRRKRQRRVSITIALNGPGPDRSKNSFDLNNNCNLKFYNQTYGQFKIIQ